MKVPRIMTNPPFNIIYIMRSKTCCSHTTKSRLGIHHVPLCPHAHTPTHPMNDPAARTFTLRASLDAKDLTPGMAVFGNLAIQAPNAEPVVPRDALLRDVQGNVSVWVVVMDGDKAVAQRRAIKVRSGQSDPVIVLEGLSKGDQVVIRGNEGLRDGDRVRVAR